jgi:iron complex outermembrane receptor protein
MMMETTMSRSLRLIFSGGVALGIGMLAQPVLAQSTDTSTAAPVQRVEITGSSIRRVDAETPSPVQVITNEELKQSGYTSIAQVLQNVTANGQGTLSQGFSGAFAAGAQAISLRGLNSSATLVLIDGHRVAPNSMFDDGQRAFVDISQIPFDAIERVEILKDGASAQYGSDAMAGVINVILKKTFTGTTVNAEGGSSTEGGGAVKHLSITSGIGDLETDGYNAFFSLEGRQQNSITNAERAGKSPNGGWTTMNWAPFGGNNSTPGVVNPNVATPTVPGSLYLYNNTGTGGATNPANFQFVSGPCNSYTKLASGGCATAPIGVVQPSTDNVNLLTSFTKRLSGDWQLAVKASAFQTVADVGQTTNPTFPQFYGSAVAANVGGAPYTVSYPNGAITVPANYSAGGVTNNLGNAAQVIGFDTSGPTAEDRIQSTNYRLVGDLTGSLGEWDTATSLGFTRNVINQNLIGTQNSVAMDAALNRATNPYPITGNASATDLGAIYTPNTSHMQTDLDFIEFHASRSLMQLAGGDLGFSAGASYTYLNVNAPPTNLYGAGLIPGASYFQYVEGKESDTALFAEVAAPVTKTLEIDGHLRFDHIGLEQVSEANATTPSLGFKWTPTQVFALRGTYATGFRAPNPAETGNSALVFAGGPDTQLCPSGPAPGVPVISCGASPIFQGASKTLSPEKSQSGTLGVILEPVKGWSSTFDLYDIKVKNQIYTPPPLDENPVRVATPQTTLCYGAAPALTPGTCQVSGLLSYINAGYENANDTETRGWELESHYKWNLGSVGTLKTSIDWSHTMSYVLDVAGVDYQLAGTHGPSLIGGDTANPKDRIQATLVYDKGPWDVTVAENYISGYTVLDPSFIGSLGLLTGNFENDCQTDLENYSGTQDGRYFNYGSPVPSNYCKVGSFATTDLTVRFKYSKQLQVHLAVNNLFNRQPPTDVGTYGGLPFLYNPSLHQTGAIGTYIQAGLTYSF